MQITDTMPCCQHIYYTDTTCSSGTITSTTNTIRNSSSDSSSTSRSTTGTPDVHGSCCVPNVLPSSVVFVTLSVVHQPAL